MARAGRRADVAAGHPRRGGAHRRRGPRPGGARRAGRRRRHGDRGRRRRRRRRGLRPAPAAGPGGVRRADDAGHPAGRGAPRPGRRPAGGVPRDRAARLGQGADDHRCGPTGSSWTLLGRGRVDEDLLVALVRRGIDVRPQVVTRVDRSPRDLVEACGGSPYGVLWQGRRTVLRRLGPTTPIPGRVRRRRARDARRRAAVRRPVGRARRPGRRTGLSSRPARRSPSGCAPIDVSPGWMATDLASRKPGVRHRHRHRGAALGHRLHARRSAPRPARRGGSRGRPRRRRPRPAPAGPLGRVSPTSSPTLSTWRRSPTRPGERGQQPAGLLHVGDRDRQAVPRLEPRLPALVVVGRPQVQRRGLDAVGVGVLARDGHDLVRRRVGARPAPRPRPRRGGWPPPGRRRCRGPRGPCPDR